MKWDFIELDRYIQDFCTFRWKSIFFLSHDWCWDFAVNHSFLMILDAQKTLDHRGFNAPKIIKNENVNSELCSFKQHHAQVLAENKNCENFITFTIGNPIVKKILFARKYKKLYSILWNLTQTRCGRHALPEDEFLERASQRIFLA